MLSYHKLFNKPVQFMRLTGLHPLQFEVLIERLTALWEQAEEERLHQGKRTRAVGAGHPYHLERLEDKLLLLLVYYRTYTTYFFLGCLFGFDASNVGRLIAKLSRLVAPAADRQLPLFLKTAYKRKKRISNWEDFAREFPDLIEVVIDATEQPLRKPAKRRKKNAYRSGKVKRYTIKTQLVVGKEGHILHVSGSVPGGIHDKRLLEQTGVERLIPFRTTQFLDRGYEGLIKAYPHHTIRLPYKRYWKQGNTLTRGQKRANTLRSQRRIVVEHVFSWLKKYQILSQTYRSAIDQYTTHFTAIAALINFRHATPITMS